MGRDYDTRTIRVEVDGECPSCGAASLLYDRRVTRDYQLHITCDDCGTVIKSKTDPTTITETVGAEYQEIVERVDVRELDLDAMFQLDEVSAGDSSIEIQN